MPLFKLHLRMGQVVDPDDIGLDLPDLHAAYLEAVRAIPDVARDQLIDARDPLTCAFIICDGKGRQLLEVPFTEVLPAAAWARRDRGRGPLSGGRSTHVRDNLALTGFRHMFSTVNVGCVLLTPELAVRAINDFGARHSHVDPDAIRGTSILDAFDLHGQPKADFTRFWRLAQQGVRSELTDMPYLVLDAAGRTVNGWWKARVWPVLDDDGRMLGLVEWAEPFTTPTQGGRTTIRVSAD